MSLYFPEWELGLKFIYYSVYVHVCDEREGGGWEVFRKGEKYDQIAFVCKTFSAFECSRTSSAELMWAGSVTPLSAPNFVLSYSFFCHLCGTQLYHMLDIMFGININFLN